MINVCSPFSFLILPAGCSASTQRACKLMPTHPRRSIIRVFLLAQAATEQMRLAQSQSLIKTSLKVTSTFRCSIWIQIWIFLRLKNQLKKFYNLWQTTKFSPFLIKYEKWKHCHILLDTQHLYKQILKVLIVKMYERWLHVFFFLKKLLFKIFILQNIKPAG